MPHIGPWGLTPARRAVLFPSSPSTDDEPEVQEVGPQVPLDMLGMRSRGRLQGKSVACCDDVLEGTVNTDGSETPPRPPQGKEKAVAAS